MGKGSRQRSNSISDIETSRTMNLKLLTPPALGRAFHSLDEANKNTNEALNMNPKDNFNTASSVQFYDTKEPLRENSEEPSQINHDIRLKSQRETSNAQLSDSHDSQVLKSNRYEQGESVPEADKSKECSEGSDQNDYNAQGKMSSEHIPLPSTLKDDQMCLNTNLFENTIPFQVKDELKCTKCYELEILQLAYANIKTKLASALEEANIINKGKMLVEEENKNLLSNLESLREKMNDDFDIQKLKYLTEITDLRRLCIKLDEERNIIKEENIKVTNELKVFKESLRLAYLNYSIFPSKRLAERLAECIYKQHNAKDHKGQHKCSFVLQEEIPAAYDLLEHCEECCLRKDIQESFYEAIKKDSYIVDVLKRTNEIVVGSKNIYMPSFISMLKMEQSSLEESLQDVSEGNNDNFLEDSRNKGSSRLHFLSGINVIDMREDYLDFESFYNKLFCYRKALKDSNLTTD